MTRYRLQRRAILPALALVCAMGLAAATLPSHAAAAAELRLPWPESETSRTVRGERITFPSHSPFTLADVGDGPERDPVTEGQGTLYLPNDVAANPMPAVVLLHGSAGALGAREHTYGRQFAASGVAAMVVDAFAARRDRARGFVDRLLEITEAMVLADAFAALRHLDARPDVDGERVALIGFSYGGMSTTYAAYAQVSERYAPEGPHFAAHVAFYAPCIAHFTDSRATGAPLLMLYGGQDAIVRTDRCEEVASDLEQGGGAVQRIVYEEAYHQWDGASIGPRAIGRDLSPCRFRVEEDGTVRDAYTFLPMWGPVTRRAILALCVDSEPYLMGRNDTVREKSNRALERFLNPVLFGSTSG